jgi:hypothetical protein
MLDAIDGGAADLHAALLAEDGDGALEILGEREHGDFDDADGARAELEHGGPTVLGFDAPRERGGLGHHAFHGAHQPLHKIDIVGGLIHEGSTVELPGTAPRRLIVVVLRTRPAHGAVGHVDATEATAIDGALEQHDGRIEPVLLDHEQVHAVVVAGLHQGVGRGQRDGHGLFADDMTPRAGRQHAMLRMQTTRRGNHHRVAGYLGQHLLDAGEERDTMRHAGLLRALGHDVAHRHELKLGNLGDGIKMVLADATAADESQADAAIGGHECFAHCCSSTGVTLSPRRK